MPGDDKPTKSWSTIELAMDLPSDHLDIELQKQHLYNLEMSDLSFLGDGTVLPGGILSRMGLTSNKLEKLAQKRGEKDFYLFLLQLIIRQAFERIDKLLAYHRAEMERLLDEIADNELRLDDLEEDQQVLDRIIDQYREEGVLNIYEPIQEVITSYNERHDKIVSKPSYSDILEIRADIEQERQVTQDEIKQQLIEFEFHQQREKSLLELKNTLENRGLNDKTSAIQILENFEADKEFTVDTPPTHPTGKGYSFIQAKKDEEMEQLSKSEGENGFSFDFPPLPADNNQVDAGEKDKKPEATRIPTNVPKF